MADKAEEAKPEEAAEGEGKKNFPLWVIMLIASNVVLLVVGFVVMSMMTSTKEAAEEEAATPTEAEQKVEPAKITDPKTLVGPEYKLESFVVNLIDDGRGPRYLKIEISFELEQEAVKAELETRLTQITDELLILLSSKRQTDIETTDGKRILRDEIFTRVNKILVTGRIKRVYFRDFVIQ